MTYGGGPSAGYIIDYSSRPRAISRWHRRLGRILSSLRCQMGFASSIRSFPLAEPKANVREFTVEEIESMDLHVLNYMYAADLYAEIWEDLPEETHGETPPDSPNVPNGIGIESYDGPNWQELPDEGTSSIAVTEQRLFSRNCPICQHIFTIGQ